MHSHEDSKLDFQSFHAFTFGDDILSLFRYNFFGEVVFAIT